MDTFCDGDSLLKSRTRVAYVLPASLLGVCKYISDRIRLDD